VTKKHGERGGHSPRWAAEPEKMMMMMMIMMMMIIIIIIISYKSNIFFASSKNPDEPCLSASSEITALLTYILTYSVEQSPS
jgi:quinol-cytochrome oxidoreductase complex cytochrome b subunit